MNGRGDLGRTPVFSQTDLAVTHKYKFGRDNRFTMAFDIDVLNAFNEANVLAVFEGISTRGINFNSGDLNLTENTQEAIRLYQTTNLSSQIAPFLTGTNQDLRYGLPTTFQGGRSVRFGFRFLF